MKRPKKLPRRRVFIFGAGVSASCGIPVAKDILRETVLRLLTQNSAEAKEIHKLLHYLYPNFDKYIRNYPNIEDFLNLIEMAMTFNSEDFIESAMWSTTRLDKSKEVILRALTCYLWSQMGDPTRLRSHRAFARNYIRPC